MWWNVGPHLKRRMAYERGERGKRGEWHDIYFHKDSGKSEFFEILARKYGNLTRAWRVALDVDENGLIDAREFASAMKRVGFEGNVRSLWYNLDADQSGYISLAEIDAEAAVALEKFRVQCVTKYGSVTAAWEKCLDVDRSGALTLQELIESSKILGYTDEDEVESLFDLLRVTPGAFAVPRHQVLFLQNWEDRKQATISRNWRRSSRWVNKDPYLTDPFAAWREDKAARKGKRSTFSAIKNPTQNVAKIMATDHHEASEMTTATDFSDVVAIDKEKAWDNFRSFLINTYGSLCKAFDVMDVNGDHSLTRHEFMNVVTRQLRYCRASEALRLFDSRVAEGDKIKFNDLGISAHDWIEYVNAKRMKQNAYNNERRALLPASSGGDGQRGTRALADHDRRMKVPGKKPLEAFWTTLPKGWGFPPGFVDFRLVADCSSTARSVPTPTFDNFMSDSVMSAR
mmetsp:Transcript_129311/g.241844  ORF Transcript_129311/g.241844 Transcript_129311/m.241844 type:complete len:457 (+) Transcript_129311:143-1513(+)